MAPENKISVILAPAIGVMLSAFLAFGEERATVSSGELVAPSSWEPAGRVFLADGKTPAPKVLIKARNLAQNKIVAEAQTDAKGNYRLPRLSPGNYSVLYGDRVCVNLRVIEGDEPVMELLNIALPPQIVTQTKEIPRALTAEK